MYLYEITADGWAAGPPAQENIKDSLGRHNSVSVSLSSQCTKRSKELKDLLLGDTKKLVEDAYTNILNRTKRSLEKLGREILVELYGCAERAVGIGEALKHLWLALMVGGYAIYIPRVLEIADYRRFCSDVPGGRASSLDKVVSFLAAEFLGTATMIWAAATSPSDEHCVAETPYADRSGRDIAAHEAAVFGGRWIHIILISSQEELREACDPQRRTLALAAGYCGPEAEAVRRSLRERRNQFLSVLKKPGVRESILQALPGWKNRVGIQSHG